MLVHVNTPLEICEARDAKGLYARLAPGQIPNFTGISDPYEVPGDAEISIDTGEQSAEESVTAVVERLITEDFVIRR